MQVTKREIIFSCGVMAIILCIGFAISNVMYTGQQSEVNRFETAAKVDNDNDLFNYLLNTKQSNICAYGEFNGGTGVTDSLIDGTYYAIKRDYEHYTRHTRTVTSTVNGKTHTRTETYYTWDNIKTEYSTSSDASFMGSPLPVTVNNYSYHSTSSIGLSDRIVFSIIPLKQTGLIHPRDIAAESIPLINTNIEDYEDSLRSNSRFIILAVSFGLGAALVVFIIFYSDWRWLNH